MNLKLNVGDLIYVKEPKSEEEAANYQKGIGYIKSKFRKPITKWRTWIVIQWMDEPIETVEYSVKDIDELTSNWNIYPVRKK